MTTNRYSLKKYVEIFIIVLISISMIMYLFHITTGIMQGDSSIYFTFCRNFFSKPFSYVDGKVSYGATSPLYCFLISIVYALFTDNYFFAMKIFSLSLLLISVIVINRALKGNLIVFFGMLATLCACEHTIFYSTGLFEVGLIDFSIALVIFSIMENHIVLSIYILGLLYLVRPEFALVTAGVDLMILFLEKNKKKNFVHMILSAIPLIIYTFYMTMQTGEIIPSSISGRILLANEFGYTIFEKWYLCIYALGGEYITIAEIVAFLLAVSFFARTVFKWERKYIYIIVIAVLIVLPQIVSPSVNYVVRYTIGIVPIILFIVGYLIKYILQDKDKWSVIIMTSIFLLILIEHLIGFERDNGMEY